VRTYIRRAADAGARLPSIGIGRSPLRPLGKSSVPFAPVEHRRQHGRDEVHRGCEQVFQRLAHVAGVRRRQRHDAPAAGHGGSEVDGVERAEVIGDPRDHAPQSGQVGEGRRRRCGT
jgi:hypothetical protein